MQLTSHLIRRSRSPRTVVGALALVAGTGLGALGISSPAGAIPVDTQTVPLNNQADEQTNIGTDCPDSSADYWHFIVAPNKNGLFSFVSMTLNVGGTSYSFGSGFSDPIIPNGSQWDNVWVAVPSGHDLYDLQNSGSSAEITPSSPSGDEQGAPMFVLSHLCVGDTPPESSVPESSVPESSVPESSVPESSVPESSVPESSVPESSVPESSVPESSVPESSVPEESSTTTVAPEESTTTVASEGPTTTVKVASEGPTTTAAASAGASTTQAPQLPTTGSDEQRTMLVLAGLMILLGGVLLLTTRRSATA